jgi:taurine---2-oxoglutarate transaminase
VACVNVTPRSHATTSDARAVRAIAAHYEGKERPPWPRGCGAPLLEGGRTMIHAPETVPPVQRDDATRREHARHVLTPWAIQSKLNPPVIVRGRGSFLYDDVGTRYLDLSAGLVAVNLGHAHPVLVDAIARQAEKICYASPALYNDERATFAAELSALAPWGEGCRAFFTTGGGEANEDAVKIARTLTGRHKVLTAYRSFHGSAPGAGTLTGENRRWPSEPGIPGVVRFFAPFPYRSPFATTDPATEVERALAHLELVISYEDPARIAALLIEPVVGTNGVIVYPDGYLAGVRRLCDRHGILLVFDEVMTGFGRTGDAFASLRFGVTPDLITFAKGSTSAYVPLGGVLVRERLASAFDERVLPCGHTYSGHPLAMATGRAALRAYREGDLFARARAMEDWMREGLEPLRARIPIVGDVRGIGAFFAIELVKDRATREPVVAWQGPDPGPLPAVLRRLLELGVYMFGRYNILVVSPPLIAERHDVDEAFAALERALGEYAATL